MEHEKNLIKLIDEFQTTGSSQSFRNIFDHFKSMVSNIARKYSRTSAVLRDEIVSELNERVWWCAKNFDKQKSTDVVSHFKLHLARAAIDVTRKKNGTYVKRSIPLDTTAEENAATFESASDFDLESYVVDRVSGEIKTDHDKRQLIEALTNNSDALTTAIVKEHLSPEQPSARQIGRKLGVHHYTVTREIRKLAKNYDASQYGDISAYLAV